MNVPPLLSNPPACTCTLLQSNSTWACLSHLIYGVRPVVLPSFLSSCDDIVQLFSGISDSKDSLRLNLYAVVCLKFRWILNKQSQRCRCSLPVLVHVYPFRAEVCLFLPCKGWKSVLCLSTERSAHIIQTNWTLGVKRAQAQYRSATVSVLLNNCK